MAYTDYQQGTGASATMMIRVHDGTTVEFWLKSGQASSWFGSATFSYASPNGSGSWSKGYSPGNTWQLMGSISVSSSGNVSWTLPATGTSGFGGPTTQTVYVHRATVPSAPSLPVVDQLAHDSFRVRFSDLGNGGAAIRERQIHYSNNPNGGQYVAGSSGSTTITVGVAQFPPGSTIYAWARVRNDVGWGPFAGPSVRAQLLPGIRIRVGGVWKYAILHVKVGGVWKRAVVYVKKNGTWTMTAL